MLSLLIPFSSSASASAPLSGLNPLSAGSSARNTTSTINATTNTAINGRNPPKDPIAAYPAWYIIVANPEQSGIPIVTIPMIIPFLLGNHFEIITGAS